MSTTGLPKGVYKLYLLFTKLHNERAIYLQLSDFSGRLLKRGTSRALVVAQPAILLVQKGGWQFAPTLRQPAASPPRDKLSRPSCPHKPNAHTRLTSISPQPKPLAGPMPLNRHFSIKTAGSITVRIPLKSTVLNVIC